MQTVATKTSACQYFAGLTLTRAPITRFQLTHKRAEARNHQTKKSPIDQSQQQDPKVHECAISKF